MTPAVIETVKAAAGATIAASSTLFTTEQTLADFSMAVFGAFLAGAPGVDGNTRPQLWPIITGLVVGLAVSLILRATALPEWGVRAGVFLAAMMSAKILQWRSDSELLAKDMANYSKAARELRKIIFGGGKGDQNSG